MGDLLSPCHSKHQPTMFKVTMIAVLLLAVVSAQKEGGGSPICAGESRLTCTDGSRPVFDGSTPPCPQGRMYWCAKPNERKAWWTSTVRPGGRGRCTPFCCDGSTPSFDGKNNNNVFPALLK